LSFNLKHGCHSHDHYNSVDQKFQKSELGTDITVTEVTL